MRELIAVYRGLVFSVARAYTRDRHDLEDACQEVLIALFRNAEKFDASRAPEPVFVTMIARRRLIDLLRTSPPSVMEGTLEDSVTPALDAYVDGRAATLALAECTAGQRDVIALATWEGLSQSEIASELDLPLGTVKSHYARGMDRLRRALNVRPIARFGDAASRASCCDRRRDGGDRRGTSFR